MRAVGKSRQEACRREDKGADTTGRRWEGVGSQGGRRTLWRESGASGRTRRKRGKAKRAQEIRKDGRQRADWLRPDAGSIRPVKKVFLLMWTGVWLSSHRAALVGIGSGFPTPSQISSLFSYIHIIFYSR